MTAISIRIFSMSDENHITQVTEPHSDSTSATQEGQVGGDFSVPEQAHKYEITGVTLSDDERQRVEEINREKEKTLSDCHKKESGIIDDLKIRLELDHSLPRFPATAKNEDKARSLEDFYGEFVANVYPEKTAREVRVDTQTLEPHIFLDGEELYSREHYRFADLLSGSGVDVGRLSFAEYMALYNEVKEKLTELRKLESKSRDASYDAEASISAVYAEATVRCFGEAVGLTLSQTDRDGLLLGLGTVVGIIEGMQSSRYWTSVREHPGAYGVGDAAASLVAENFLKLARGRASMPEDLSDACGQFFDEKESVISDVLYDPMTEKFEAQQKAIGGVRDLEGQRAFFFGDSPQQIAKKREENWVRVGQFLQEVASRPGAGVTVDDVERIQALSCDRIFPQKSLGIRTEGYETRVDGSVRVAGSRVREALEDLLERANAAVRAQVPDALFDFMQASTFAEFADIHPLMDGNGQTGIFLLEALSGQRGLGVPGRFQSDFKERALEAFHGNRLAFYYAGLATQARLLRSHEKELAPAA